MTDWPSRTWAVYPGPNRCEAGCGRDAVVRLVWAHVHAQTERYCATCAAEEETRLEAAGAGCACVSLSSIIGGNPTNEDPVGAENTDGVNPCAEASEQ